MISWVAADSAARNVGFGTTRGPGGEHIDLTRAVIFCALGLVCAFSVFCLRNESLTCCCPWCMLCMAGAASLDLYVDGRRWSASGCGCLCYMPLCFLVFVGRVSNVLFFLACSVWLGLLLWLWMRTDGAGLHQGLLLWLWTLTAVLICIRL
jgi:hypothetical protein